jgi:hypothetical protein
MRTQHLIEFRANLKNSNNILRDGSLIGKGKKETKNVYTK